MHTAGKLDRLAVRFTPAPGPHLLAAKVCSGAIDDDVLSNYLYTAGLPDPDLLIRTGGELRVSNFLLYQIAYSELWSTNALWPAFDGALLHEALLSFSRRQRRFGS